MNHLYWSAVSTPDGDGEMILAKWLSVDNHIHNKHKKHGKLFPACKHKRIQMRGRKKKWFKPRKCPALINLLMLYIIVFIILCRHQG